MPKVTHKSIRSEERDLIRRAKRGDGAAMQILLEAHEPFMRSMARYYSRVQGFAFEDALQETRCGFVEGVHRFDLRRNVKLLTFAAWWARHYVKRALQNSVGDIRIPVGKQQKDKMRPIRAVRLDAEVRGAFGESTGDVLVDTLPSDCAAPDEQADEDRRAAKMRDLYTKAMAGLNERERLIARARLARDDQDKLTLNELGERLGVCRERVRQIECLVVRKMRRALRGSGVRELLAA